MRFSPAALLLFSLFGSAVVFSYVPPLGAAESLCRPPARKVFRKLIREAEALELLYATFRRYEFSYRVLTYDLLWKARYDELDPLDKNKREVARDAEHKLKKQISRLRSLSQKSAGSLENEARLLKNASGRFDSVCRHPAFRDCIRRGMTPAADTLQNMLKQFELIFENERVFRKAVELTAADREGLYPLDALEKPHSHGDYYRRFERERARQRFEEDRAMTHHFHSLRAFLRDADFEGCCHSCAVASAA